jgi:hypothetical protein
MVGRGLGLVAAVAALMCSSGLHAQVQCGAQPQEVPPDVQQRIQGDVEGKAQAFTKLLGDVNLKGKVDASRNEVYQKYNDVDKAHIDHYMIWVSCQNIMLDKQLSARDKSVLWIEIYRELIKPSEKQAERRVRREAIYGGRLYTCSGWSCPGVPWGPNYSSLECITPTRPGAKLVVGSGQIVSDPDYDAKLVMNGHGGFDPIIDTEERICWKAWVNNTNPKAPTMEFQGRLKVKQDFIEERSRS